jgi:hypothetical protein
MEMLIVTIVLLKERSAGVIQSISISLLGGGGGVFTIIGHKIHLLQVQIYY